jgi:hypothetical protein
MNLLQRYFALLERRPLPTKIASALVIFSTSDVIAQVYENAEHHKFKGNPLQEFTWEPTRTMRITVFGGIVTVWLHGWWNLLERVIEKRISSKTHHYANALTKVFFDQALGAPVFNTLFFTSQQLMQGKPFDESLLRTVETRVPVMLEKHYHFWPWVHVINFSFVSLHRRLLVQNVLTIGWAAYLSHCDEEFEKEQKRDKLPDTES